MNWKILDSDEELSRIIQSSDTETLAIFKHSTRCGVSRMAKSRIERDYGELPSNFKFHYLDLLTYRPLSDAIESVLEVEHESPQLLLVKNGKCVFHASHTEINMVELAEKIRLFQN